MASFFLTHFQVVLPGAIFLPSQYLDWEDSQVTKITWSLYPGREEIMVFLFEFFQHLSGSINLG